MAAGDEVTINYGPSSASNMELLAKYGFLLPGNLNGALLPFDFYAALKVERVSSSGDGSCRDVLRSPRLRQPAEPGELPLEPDAASCLRERLRGYYAASSSDSSLTEAKAMELIGQLCRQILQKYHQVADSINRLQQSGQREGDWMTLQVAHEAVDDMQRAQSCVDAGASAAEKAAAYLSRDDL